MGRQRSPIRVVLFDWGGTLMRDIPGFDGPMADWPRVEAVPGAEEALRALHGRYLIAVATNAALSNERLVRAALARVGLAAYVSVVVTARDLGLSKPDLAFFHAVLERVGCSAAEAVMVGDGYGADIVGAKSAGLRAVWFNPDGARCPLVHPVHDAEIQMLGELPCTLGQSLLPDVTMCLQLLHEHGVPENIVRHSAAVAAVAHWLALRLRESGVEVDPLLAHRGGLLHDLDKLSSEKPTDHGVQAGRILRNLGWAALARIAERHVLGTPPETWEEKLVHYADKIVEGDRVVGLIPRLAALSRRYPPERERIAAALPPLRSLEEEIAAALRTSPDELRAELGRLDVALPPFVVPPDPAYDR
ncbi:HAD-IIIA family hydrolase [Candidatus Bipolaricaulota bacterium]|nr:HAD-IIIA family hydrolase [Candidatus Bipolaricaulota bacterium]